MKTKWVLQSAILAFVGASCSILSAQQPPRAATPGTVNYIEGQVSIDGNAINRNQIGYSQLQTNQVLSTGNARAEVLLSPGVFVRVRNNSQLRMVSTDLANPQVEVVQGEAMVEVDAKLKDARIGVLEHGAESSILKNGLYEFDSDAARVQVFDGKVQVTENGQSKELGRGRQVTLTAARLKPVSFDTKAEDDLYRWSSVRDGYLAEANIASARNVEAGYGPSVGTGWYWNPYFGFWSWLPGDGFFYSPFGYPFFSPGYVGFAGRYGFGRYGYRGGFAGRGFSAMPRGGFARGGGFHGGGRR